MGATYLSRDELLEIYDALMRRYGGMPGVRDEGALESCLALPKTVVFGVERFPTAVEKAAAYCFFIIRNHPFFDGNKRTGFVAGLHFLRVNRVEARFDAESTYDIILRVAKGQADLDDVTSLISAAVARAPSSTFYRGSEGERRS